MSRSHRRGTTGHSARAIPLLAWLLIPFTASVAASRVVLGLHYPSDVLAATAIGLALASLLLWLVPGASLLA